MAVISLHGERVAADIQTDESLALGMVQQDIAQGVLDVFANGAFQLARTILLVKSALHQKL